MHTAACKQSEDSQQRSVQLLAEAAEEKQKRAQEVECKLGFAGCSGKAVDISTTSGTYRHTAACKQSEDSQQRSAQLLAEAAEEKQKASTNKQQAMEICKQHAPFLQQLIHRAAAAAPRATSTSNVPLRMAKRLSLGVSGAGTNLSIVKACDLKSVGNTAVYVPTVWNLSMYRFPSYIRGCHAVEMTKVDQMLAFDSGKLRLEDPELHKACAAACVVLTHQADPVSLAADEFYHSCAITMDGPGDLISDELGVKQTQPLHLVNESGSFNLPNFEAIEFECGTMCAEAATASGLLGKLYDHKMFGKQHLPRLVMTVPDPDWKGPPFVYYSEYCNRLDIDGGPTAPK